MLKYWLLLWSFFWRIWDFAFGKSETSNYFLLWEKMKNFIKFNIDNVKGKPRASSLIEQDTRKASPTKPKFNVNPHRQYPYNQ